MSLSEVVHRRMLLKETRILQDAVSRVKYLVNIESWSAGEPYCSYLPSQECVIEHQLK